MREISDINEINRRLKKARATCTGQELIDRVIAELFNIDEGVLDRNPIYDVLLSLAADTEKADEYSAEERNGFYEALREEIDAL